MSQSTRMQVLEKLRRRYATAGREHKRKLIDQAVQLLGYHRKAAIRALRRQAVERGPLVYSLKIGESWHRIKQTGPAADWEVYPTTPWNYGLVLDAADPAAG